MTEGKVKLVLNLNTPSFFNKSSFNNSSSKRPLDSALIENVPKKPKISIGQHFKQSSFLRKKVENTKQKPKLNQSLVKNRENDVYSFNKKDASKYFPSIFNNNSRKAAFQNSVLKKDVHIKEKKKREVKFSTTLSVHQYDTEKVEMGSKISSPEFNKTKPISLSEVKKKKQTSLSELKKEKQSYSAELKKKRKFSSDIKNMSTSDESLLEVSKKAQAPSSEFKKRTPTSNLFTKNPEIPSIPKFDTEPVMETVFSNETFKDSQLDPHLIGNVENQGYTSMTQVQQLALPHLLNGKDALIKSQTGSGKTLAYALAIVHHLMQVKPKICRKDGTFALIIVPTRELAIQSYQWIEKLCKACVWIVPGYLIGGEKRKAEKGRLRKGINILVATPGRLIDHIDTTYSLSLENVQYLVLDEADRMLEMGYEKGVMRIVHTLDERSKDGSTRRQTILLSATLTGAVEKLAGISLNSPEIIDVSHNVSGTESLAEYSLVTPENLSQYYVIVPAKLRLATLASFILSECGVSEERKMLIFMTTQDMVDYHTSLFSYIISKFEKVNKSKVLSGSNRFGTFENDPDSEDESEEIISFFKLHGSMTQGERSAVFKSFSESSSGVLLCTDVAARGLDLPKVNWIVQYNAACIASDYVHRVGRTARASNIGSALVFLTPAEVNYVNMLQEHRIVLQELEVRSILKGLLHPALSSFLTWRRNNEESTATQLQIKFEDKVEEDKDLHMMGRAAYVSFIRSYASYPKVARRIFRFRDLHLGHYAKSFALRESPSGLGARLAQKKYRPPGKCKKGEYINKSLRKPMPPRRTISEFDSGLESLKEKKNKGRIVATFKTKKTLQPRPSLKGPKFNVNKFNSNR